jgi:hypothetical protein
MLIMEAHDHHIRIPEGQGKVSLLLAVSAGTNDK